MDTYIVTYQDETARIWTNHILADNPEWQSIMNEDGLRSIYKHKGYDILSVVRVDELVSEVTGCRPTATPRHFRWLMMAIAVVLVVDCWRGWHYDKLLAQRLGELEVAEARHHGTMQPAVPMPQSPSMFGP